MAQHKFVHISLTPEKITGYVDYKAGGPKHCFSCFHYEKEKQECNGPKMKEFSERPRAKDGDVKVHPVGLCKWWEKEK